MIVKIINTNSNNMKKHIIFQSFDKKACKFFLKSKEEGKINNKIRDNFGFELIKPNNVGYNKKLLFNPLILIIISIRNLLGKKNNVYTVNRFWEMVIVDFIGNKGIITDRVDILQKYLKVRNYFNIFITFLLIIFIR
jgi:hypothetical protein